MKRVHIITDGNNTAYRCNSVTELYTKDGRRVSAIYNMLNSLNKDIMDIEVQTQGTVVESIVAWDKGKNKRRMKLCPEYKANRHEDETEDDKLWFAEFLEQVKYLQSILPNFGIKQLQQAGQEADDLAYVCVEELKSKYPDDLIVCVSNDEDWAQQVCDQVFIWLPIKKIMLTPKNFVEMKLVPPSLLPEQKALEGDKSDNIKGVDGIGPKKAANILNTFGGIAEAIASNDAKLKKSVVFKKLWDEDIQNLIQRNLEMIDFGYVDQEEVIESVTMCINEQATVNSKEVMKILQKNEMISLLAAFTRFIAPFKKLAN